MAQSHGQQTELRNRLAAFRKVVAALAATTLLGGAASGQGPVGAPTPPEVVSMPIGTADGLLAAIGMGGTFSLGEGVIEVPGELVIATDLKLKGFGSDATVLELRGAPTALRVAPGVRFELEDLTLRYVGEKPADLLLVDGAELVLTGVTLAGAEGGPDMTGTKSFGVGSGLVATPGSRLTLVNTDLVEHGLSAFELYGDTAVSMQGGQVSQNSVGFYAQDDVNLEVREVRIANNDLGGLRATGAATVLIERSIVVENGRAHREGSDPALRSDALRAIGTVTLRLVSNRILDNERHALSADENAVVESSGNWFEGNGGSYEAEAYLISPIVLDGESRLQSESDTFQGNPGGTIELAEASGAQLMNVVIRGNAMWSHVYMSGSSWLDVVNATIEGNEGAIYVGASARFSMRDSRVVGTVAQDAIIVEEQGQVSLLANLFEGNAYAGVSFAGTSGGVVAFNRFTGNLAGVVVMDTAEPELRENQMQGNGDDVLRL